jgi:hypothetical protein
VKGNTLVLCVGLGLTCAGVTTAETVHCTPISTLPATIATEGVYCLQGNLASASVYGSAIQIVANNVTLDLNGWTLDGRAAGTATWAYGISSLGDSVTVKNGTVRGFLEGVRMDGAGALVEDLLVDQVTVHAIVCTNRGAVVRHNRVTNTGGSTIGGTVWAIGIVVNTREALVEDNLVSGLRAPSPGEEVGIALYGAQATARRNVVMNTPHRGSGPTTGIRVRSESASVSGVAVLENEVIHFGTGISFENGASGTYSRNTAVDCSTPYSGGTAGSGND